MGGQVSRSACSCGRGGEVLVGTVLGGRYRVDRPLGEGACGAVVVAVDLVEDVKVAVKIQPEQTFESTSWYARAGEILFVTEKENLARLSGIRGIPGYRDQGEAGSRRYVVMDLVEGMTLEAFIRNPGAQRAAVAASVLGQLCEILADVHGRGLVHRDIKPENIMVEPNGEIRLIDMGFARFIGAVENFASGTKGYSAPEQHLDGAVVTVAGDIFSLGCVLFRMSVLGLPYGGNARGATKETEIFPPGRLDMMSPELRSLGLAMVAADPAERPADVLEVLHRLAPVLPVFGETRDPKIRRPDVTQWYRRGRGRPISAPRT
ncbi:serine/threonine-protein kinase [Spirillospora sp. NPDC050365]